MNREERISILKEEFQDKLKSGEYKGNWDFELYLQAEYKEAQYSNSHFGRKKETFEEWIINTSNWIFKRNELRKELKKESDLLREKEVKKNKGTGMTVHDVLVSGFDEDQAKMFGIDSDL